MNQHLESAAVGAVGHFAQEEGRFVQRVCGGLKHVLEVGCYFGCSSLWILSAIAADGILVSVDPFKEYGLCKGHTAATCNTVLYSDSRWRLITGTTVESERHVASYAPYDAVLLDGDHSFRWTAFDAATAIAHSRVGGVVLFHDHQPGFDGVSAVVRVLVEMGVLKLESREKSLAACRILRRPAWLIEARNTFGEELK